MEHQLSHEGEAARRAVIDEIYRAFEGVTREGGVSWNETDVRDGYGTPEECEAARRSDKDTSWAELVEDRNWEPFPGVGGFCFVDATGFRYYFPVVMVRFARGDVSEWFPGHLLEFLEQYAPSGSRVWTAAQLRATARFIEFMAKFDPTGYREAEDTKWEDALRQVWAPYLSIEVEEPRRKRIREVKRK